MRVSSRPVVDLPQPDSPTRPSVSPRRTAKSSPSTARTAPLPPPKRPFLIGKCLRTPVTSRRFSVIIVPLGLQRRRDGVGEDRRPLGRGQVAGDAVRTLAGQQRRRRG